ncbi:MAG: hypothetical protein L3J39_03165 [Verrucomicrobiales bacterium]|nr:hypothetical protein [Verrucomicrobiales bacterium]
MKNFGTILLIVGFFLLVTVGVFSVVASFLNREFVDIYRPFPPPTFERMIVADERFAQREGWQVEDAYAMELRTGDAAKALSDYEAGWEKSRSEDREVLLEARDHLLRVVSKYRDDELTPKATLYLGRVLVRLEDWEAAKKALGTINKNKDWLDKLGRAEAIFLYGMCLEKLGETDDAIKVYNATIAVYGEYAEWSLQALQHGFELAYRIDDLEKKIKAYSYLNKLIYMFHNFGNNREGRVSELMKLLRERRDEVKVELGISEEQEREIDRKLGIIYHEPLDRDGGLIWIFNKANWLILALTGLLTIFSYRNESPRFWRYFFSLALVSVLACIGYWVNAEMMYIIHAQQRAVLGLTDSFEELTANGQIYHRKLSFAMQTLLGLFVMVVALVFRKIKSSTMKG